MATGAVGSAHALPAAAPIRGPRRKPILETPSNPPRTQRRRPISECALISTPVAEAADRAAAEPAPLQAQVASQGEVGSLDNPSRKLTLRELQQVKLLGNRAPKPLLRALGIPGVAICPAKPGEDGSTPQGYDCPPAHQEATPAQEQEEEQQQVGPAAATSTQATAAHPAQGHAPGPGYKNSDAGAGVRVGAHVRVRENVAKKSKRRKKAKFTVGGASALVQRAKLVAESHATGIASGMPATNSGLFTPAYHLAKAYESCLGVYRARKMLRYIRGPVAPGTPNYGAWLHAAAAADTLGMDYQTYVEAQFWFFDKWFARAPQPRELIPSAKSKFPADERAISYVEMLQSGEIKPGHRTVCRSQPVVRSSGSDRSAASQRKMEQLMALHALTAQEALQAFAGTGMFDLTWLKNHPEYRALQSSGAL